MLILIDPGHGGTDPGAVATTGQREDRTNLNVAGYLKTALEAAGHTVIMTRTAHDQTVSIAARQAVIKAERPDLVISIHHNGASAASAHGAEVCAQINSLTGAYDNKSYRLAGFILSEFETLGQNIRGIIRKANSSGNADYYGILRTAATYGIPAVITEYAFMTAADVCDVDTYAEQKAEAEAIAKAVKEYAA